jgi:uncharacterized membrane protein
MSEPNRSRFANLRDAFFSGALVLAPLVVSLWAFHWVIDSFGGAFRPLFFFFLPERLRDQPSIAVLLDIVATCILIVLVTALGYVSRAVFGKFFLRVAERFMLSIPGVGAVYVSVKQIVDTFSTQKHQLFTKVVLVEFPRKGVWAVGFLTNRSQGEAQAKAAQGVLWTVFVPTTPNPTGGYVLLLPPGEVIALEMSVGEGMKMIISGGAVVPPWPAEAKGDPQARAS